MHLYIVPGAGEPVSSRKYTNIATAAQKLGYEVTRIQPKWRTVWSETYVQIVIDAVTEPDAVLLGFSWGALACFLAAAKVKPKGLILCSLSPWLTEDRYAFEQVLHDNYPRARVTEALLKSAGSFSIVKKIRSKTILLLGSKEDDLMKHRSQLVANNIPAAQFMLVAGVGHDIRKPAYQRMVRKALASFASP